MELEIEKGVQEKDKISVQGNILAKCNFILVHDFLNDPSSPHC